MPNILPSTATQVLDGIASTPGQAAGQTIEEWLAYSKFQRIVAESEAAATGHIPVYRWSNDAGALKDLDDIVNETTANGAWQAYKTGGNPVSPGGAATQPPTINTNPQTAIKTPGAQGATAGGLLTMTLPTWTAAVAPLLGIAVGAGLYEASPEFWTRLSQTLLPFCYPESQCMPVVVDGDGNTWVDKEAVEALKQFFEDEGINNLPESEIHVDPIGNVQVESSSTVLSNVSASSQYQHGSAVDVGPGWLINVNDSVYQVVESGGARASTTVFWPNGETRTQNFILTGIEVTYKGKTYNVYRGYWGYDAGTISVSQANTDNWDLIIPALVDGAVTPMNVKPDGLSDWEGRRVDIDSLPTTTVYTNPGDATQTRDYIPVALPTEPGESLDPEENPDPTENEDTEEQISPYIMPDKDNEDYPEGGKTTDEEGQELPDGAPIPSPIPDGQQLPDPDADPTTPDERPPQQLVDIIPPIDLGDINWPSNPSTGGDGSVDGGVGGLVSVYNPTYAELQAFSQWLWVTYADATIDKIWNNPFDGIISLHELYATPITGARKYIKSGFLVSPVEALTVPTRYSEINCGTAIFPEYYGNYLDYSPYSKALCYLPFIGIVELNVDDIVGHAVNITYRVDSYSGACIALLSCAKEGSDAVLYQFCGNCSVQMPIAGGTQAAIKAAQLTGNAYQNAYHVAGLAGIVGGIGNTLAGLVTGNIGQAIMGPLNGASAYATNQAWGQAAQISQTVAAKSSVQHSGQFGESFGAMGAKKPYMIIKRPVQVVVNNYQDEYGYPAHKYVTIGECTGYLRCRGVHVASARATDTERIQIEDALMQGVFVT